MVGINKVDTKLAYGQVAKITPATANNTKPPHAVQNSLIDSSNNSKQPHAVQNRLMDSFEMKHNALIHEQTQCHRNCYTSTLENL